MRPAPFGGYALSVRPALYASLLAAWTGGCAVPEFRYPEGAPRILRFDLEPAAPAVGAPVTVRYEVEGATELEVTGGPTSPLPLTRSVGEYTFTADRDRTLTLEAKGVGGARRAQVAITLATEAPVQILHFEAIPATSYPGATIELVWRTRSARKVTIYGSEPTPLYEGPQGEGRLSWTVTDQDVLFTLRADGDQGPRTATTAVTLEPRAPLILAFDATPVTISVGEQVTLRWQTASAQLAYLTREGPTGIGLPELVQTSGNLVDSPNAGLHRYHLRAENGLGITESSVAVWVQSRAEPEILEFTVTPTVVGAGGDTRASWRIANIRDTSDVSVSVYGPNFSQSGLPPSGNFDLPIPASGEVTLFLQRFDGMSWSAVRPVRVDPELPRLNAVLSAADLGPGELVTISGEATGHDLLRVEDGQGNLVGTTTVARFSFSVVAATTTTFLVSATNRAGSTRRHLPLFVGPLPTIDSFSADATTYRAGRGLCFEWSARDADWVLLSVGFGATIRWPAVGRWCLSVSEFAGSAVLDAVNLRGSVQASINLTSLPAVTDPTEQEPNDVASVAAGPYWSTPVNWSGVIDSFDQDLFVWSGPPEVRPRGNTSPSGGCPGPIELEVFEDRLDPTTRRSVLIPSAGGCPLIDAALTPLLAEMDPPLLFAVRGVASGPYGYELFLDVEPRRCGDGVVDRGEDCDDGGFLDGDGCSSACFRETAEREPNSGNPMPLTIGGTLDGYLAPGDLDYFSVSVDFASTGPYRLAVVPSAAEGLDCRVSVFDSARGYSIDGVPLGPTGGAVIEGTALYLEPGLHLISVSSGSSTVLPRRGPYRLTLDRL